MRQRYVRLAILLTLLAVIIWIVLPNNPGIRIGSFSRSLDTVLGLDLRGGIQVLLEADLPESVPIVSQELQDARLILENRANALGVSEVVFQVAGERRIVGEFPGLTNVDQVLETLKGTGLLEFVDLGNTPLPDGTIIQTDYRQSTEQSSVAEDQQLNAEIGDLPPALLTPGDPGTQPSTEAISPVWNTVLTGDQLRSVGVRKDTFGNYAIQFSLKPDGQKAFAEYTKNNIGSYLAIVLDKEIISAPRVQSAIPDGSGEITGNFTYDSANNLAIQLRYGSLPIPFKIVESRVIGPTLGQDSLQKSLVAGIIGFTIVALFMILYYRLPGFLAILSITYYALFILALFKLIPVTLTLPGIAGFLLSTGGALDANILIFERLKEELRAGKVIHQATELGWKRAWPSIRDSNIATLITSAILFWFGSTYGATFVKGFALTLAIGVAVSLFAAILITRTLLNFAISLIKNPSKHMNLFGL